MAQTFYRPFLHFDDGTNLEYHNIAALKGKAFCSKKDCRAWLKENGYDLGSIVYDSFEASEIDETTEIINCDGDVVKRFVFDD